MKPTNEQITAAARALSDDNADVCNVNREDNWNIYGDSFRETARVALEAAAYDPCGSSFEFDEAGRTMTVYGDDASIKALLRWRKRQEDMTNAALARVAPPPAKLSTETVDKPVHKLTDQEILRIAANNLEMGDLLRSMRTAEIYGDVQVIKFARALLAASDSQGGAA